VTEFQTATLPVLEVATREDPIKNNESTVFPTSKEPNRSIRQKI